MAKISVLPRVDFVALAKQTGWGRDTGHFHHFVKGRSSCGQYRLAGVLDAGRFPIIARQLVRIPDAIGDGRCCQSCAAIILLKSGGAGLGEVNDV